MAADDFKFMMRLALLIFSVASVVRAGQPAALNLTRTIPLSGVKGRFDHFAIDEKGRRLFAAALGNNTLEVIDVAAGKPLRSITGLHEPTGVSFLADQNRIAVANGHDGTLKLFDGSSYALANTIPSLDDADNVRFDAKTKLIYVGYSDGALAIVDSAAMKQIGSVKLSGHPESFQLEQQGSRIFMNVPDAKQIAVVDRDKRTMATAWPMKEFQANFPMALNEPDHRLFVGCRRPARLVVLDTATGKTVNDLEISGDTDDLFYDSALRRIYVSCGEGFIDVIEQLDPDHYRRRERIATRNGARTSYFSTGLNEFYLAVPQRGGQEAEIRVFQPQK
jgi:DNA-binding beta-propeller fold protein YncE